MRPLESVPNFSEGRDRATIDAIGTALGRTRGCSTSTATPITTARSSRSSATSRSSSTRSLAAVCGRERADRPALRTKVRTRASAPPTSCRSCRSSPTTSSGRGRCAAIVGQRLGVELGLPVFVYAPPERGPAFYRRGGPASCSARIDCGELAPDFGPTQLDSGRGRRDRRGAAAADRVQRQPARRRRRRARGRRRRAGDAAAAFPACGRSGSTCRAPGSSRSR